MLGEEDKNELAEQLARINEQLAFRNRRAKRIWKTIAIVIAAGLLIWLLLAFLLSANPSNMKRTEESMSSDREVFTVEEVVEL